jgi:hydrogenase nickel incorporation protein HypB
MCGVCGCGEGETRVDGEASLSLAGATSVAAEATGHAHDQHVHNEHSHDEHSHGVSPADTAALRQTPEDDTRLLRVEQDLLAKNNSLAAHNREHFSRDAVLALNLVSSPGAGKTTLLVATLEREGKDWDAAVIEGDQETSADADRIRATGVPAIQVNTGRGCHLDAQMVHSACHKLTLEERVLFIENVGNLVCPAGFDLGEAHKVVIASVTEGEDKPLKYPNMFAAASLMLVSKVDLLPHLDFDVAALIANARRVNPAIGVIQLSASSGEGMDKWLAWIGAARQMTVSARP